MKKLYLHMGFPKTGTTSFQETCRINTDILLGQGYLYPLFASRESCGSKEEFEKAYTAATAACLAFDKNVIISAEAISQLSKDYLRQFKSLFESYGFEIIPFVAVRSPYELACSAKQQGIRAGQVREDDFFPSVIDRVENLKAVFPEISFYAYNEMRKHKDGAVGFLFEKIGVNYKDFEIIRANISLSNTITRIQGRLNKINEAMIDNKVNKDFISIKDLDSQDFKEKYRMTEEEFKSLSKFCEKENAYFKKYLGEEFTDRAIEFNKEDPLAKLGIAIIDALAKR